MNMKPQRLNIEIGEKEAEGIYANLAMITHSPTEIILDFARIMPGAPKTRVQARIIMTPAHAKMLLKTLQENLKKFEKQFGEIKIQGGPDAMQGKSIGFETPGTNEEQKDG
ncbi:MAG: DUF3467 domain-containing protein [candidate division Zixibacteria bacterium]|nr:DUF3467 domain-containing protein [candidate division Zixibacteria bacterium]